MSSRNIGSRFIACGAAVMGLFGAAAAEQESPATLSFVWENDTVADTDRYYTNGLKLSYVSREGEGARLARLLLRAGDGANTRFGAAIGHSIFTPDNTIAAASLPDDHPYAGWFYLQGSSLVERRSGAVDILSVSAGVVGPAALGEEAQNAFHSIIGDREAAGWDNQLRNEPGFVASFDRIWRPMKTGAGIGFDVLPFAGLSAGNVLTEARAGTLLRVGEGLAQMLGPARIGPSLPAAGYMGAQKVAWSIFGGAQARAVARNIFLDGNTGRDSLSVEKENLVGEFELGAAIQFRGVQVAYTHVFRTKEFETQPDGHQFGALTISKSF